MDFTMDSVATIDFIKSDSGGIKISDSVDIKVIKKKLSYHCSLPAIASWFVNLDKIIAEKFEDSIKKLADSLANTWTAPQVYMPSDDIRLTYTITDAIFRPKIDITAMSNGKVEAYANVSGAGYAWHTYDAP